MKLKHIALILFLLASCKHQTFEEKLQQNFQKSWNEYFQENFDDNKEIDVFVATNRGTKNNIFGCDDKKFDIKIGQKLWLGSCRINVPKNHEVGEIFFATDENQSLDNVFKVISSNSFSEQEFFLNLQKSQRTPLIFVHGFNVRYQEALFRAAQIAYDLKYQGPIILFSWPAGANDGIIEGAMFNKTYEENLINAKNSVSVFKDFLINLEKNKIKVNLMVHSMGHQVVLNALGEVAKENQAKVFLNKLILNAPDFDVVEFKKIFRDIKKISNSITLYCSAGDKALAASKIINKSNRLGSCVYSTEIDVIDAGLIDNDAISLGHGYYSSRSLLTDISQYLVGIEKKNRLFIAKVKIGDKNDKEKYFLRR